jgi:hypothetical protein
MNKKMKKKRKKDLLLRSSEKPQTFVQSSSTVRTNRLFKKVLRTI